MDISNDAKRWIEKNIELIENQDWKKILYSNQKIVNELLKILDEAGIYIDEFDNDTGLYYQASSNDYSGDLAVGKNKNNKFIVRKLSGGYASKKSIHCCFKTVYEYYSFMKNLGDEFFNYHPVMVASSDPYLVEIDTNKGKCWISKYGLDYLNNK